MKKNNSKKSKALSPLLRALQKGDIVDVVAPGFGCEIEDLNRGLEWLKAQGFIPRVSDQIFGEDLLHAQSEKLRAQDLVRALRARDSKAIWFLRGGYGTNRLIPYLKKIKNPNKILIGISDITSLHCYSLDHWKLSVMHGPLLDRIAKGLVPEDVLKEVLQVVQGHKTEVKFENLMPLNKKAKTKKDITAQLVGGNLKVIESHIGTPDELKLKNRIVMFEEIGERAYRVDRMLFHFEQAGLFKNLAGVIFGQFIQDNEPGGTPGKTQALLKIWAEKQKFPVLAGLPCGHDTEQRILPLGTKAVLKLGPKPSLIVPTGVQLCD
ncbi:MAG: LD-carboxypeptidase [Bdellovibrionales bacterium]